MCSSSRWSEQFKLFLHEISEIQEKKSIKGLKRRLQGSQDGEHELKQEVSA